MHTTSPSPCANRIPRLAPSQRALVNLNSAAADDEPTGPVTAADLIRTIQARDAQQWQRQPLHIVFASGAVGALPLTAEDRRFWAVPMDQPLMPAECGTEIGANQLPSKPKPRMGPVFPLERWFIHHPTATTVAVLLAILLLWGLASHSDVQAEELVAEAVEQLAQEVQP